MRVVLLPLVSRLREAEDPPDHQEQVLDLGTHLRFRPVLRSLDLIDFALAAVAAIRHVLRLRRARVDHRRVAPVRRPAPHFGLLAVQQIRPTGRVVNIGRRRDDRLNQFCATVDSDAFMPKYH